MNGAASDVLIGYDAVPISKFDNELRIVNRNVVSSTKIKDVSEMKSLYPETPRKDGIRGAGVARKYEETLSERYKMIESRVSASKSTQGLSIGSPVQMKTIAGAPRRMPLQKATASTQAKIASSIAMETVEDNVGRVVQRAGATSRLLGAATEASAHVAGGAGKSGLLRQAAAAATILKTIT